MGLGTKGKASCSGPPYSGPGQEATFFRHAKDAKKMSACGQQPSRSNRLGETGRLAVFLLFYKEKGFCACPLVDPAGIISAKNRCLDDTWSR